MASAALATGRVLSRNHCSGATLRRRALFARRGRPTFGPAPPRDVRQRHRLVAQRHGGDARRTLLLAGLFAGLHARALPTHLDAAAAARGTAPMRTSSNRRRVIWSPSAVRSLASTRSTFARTSNSTCGACSRRSTNRSTKSASRSRVHSTRVSGSCSRACAQSRRPSIQRNDLRSSRAFGAVLCPAPGRLLGRGPGGVEASPQDAQRHPLGVDRQRRVQVQPAGHGAGLVAADRAQSLRLAASRAKFSRVPSCIHSTI